MEQRLPRRGVELGGGEKGLTRGNRAIEKGDGGPDSGIEGWDWEGGAALGEYAEWREDPGGRAGLPRGAPTDPGRGRQGRKRRSRGGLGGPRAGLWE